MVHAAPIDRMANLRMPLEPEDIGTYVGNCLCIAYAGSRKEGKAVRYYGNLVGVGGPDPYPVRISAEYLVVLADIDFNGTVTARTTGSYLSAEGKGDDVEAKTNPEDRDTEIEILGAPSRLLKGRSPPENDTAAFRGYPIRGMVIPDHPGIDIDVPEHPENEMVELSMVVHHVNREHAVPNNSCEEY